MNKRLINSIFKTPLGEVVCGLDSSSSTIHSIWKKEYKNGNSELFKVDGHNIELVEFKIQQPLYNGETISDSKGWIWRIEKTSELDTELTLSCEIINTPFHIEFDTSCGEHLDAMTAYNHDWKLNISSEDGEILHSRAKKNDWFPNRLQSKVDFYQSITEIKDNGLQTTIPALLKGEKIHLQFITAFAPKAPNSVNTWLAVDEFKHNLENWIGIS